MKSTSVREIKKAIHNQTFKGERRVYLDAGNRIVDVRTVKGQLQARTLQGQWLDVQSVNID